MLRICTSPGVHSALVRVIRRQWRVFGQLFEGREVLHRVGVAEEDQRALAVRVAVEALVRVGAVDADQAAVVVRAGAVLAGSQRVGPDGVGALLRVGLFGERGGALDIGKRRRVQGRLRVPQCDAGADADRHAGEADREGAIRPPGEHPGEADRILDQVVGRDGGDQGDGDDGEARRDRQRPPDRGGEDQRRPVPQVPGVGDAADVADRPEREQAGGPPFAWP